MLRLWVKTYVFCYRCHNIGCDKTCEGGQGRADSHHGGSKSWSNIIRDQLESRQAKSCKIEDKFSSFLPLHICTWKEQSQINIWNLRQVIQIILTIKKNELHVLRKKKKSKLSCVEKETKQS